MIFSSAHFSSCKVKCHTRNIFLNCMTFCFITFTKNMLREIDLVVYRCHILSLIIFVLMI